MLWMELGTSCIPGKWCHCSILRSYDILKHHSFIFLHWKTFPVCSVTFRNAYMFCWWRWFEWGETTLVCYLCQHSFSGTQLWRCCLLYCLNFHLQNIPLFHTALTRLICSVILYLSQQLCFYSLIFTKDNYGFVLSFCLFPWLQCFLTFPGHLPHCVRYK